MTIKEFTLKVICPILFCAIVFQALVETVSEAAGTVSISETTFTNPKRIIFKWISDATGEALAITANNYSGHLVQTTITNGTGANQPTDLYDIVLYDSNTSEELLGGAGLDNSTSVVSRTISDASLGWVVESKLIMSVQNAGPVKSGTVIIYISP